MRYGLLGYVLTLLLILPSAGYASIIKGPYLQKASSSSMTMMWETSAPSASEVDYGPTSLLGLTATGPSGTIHEVTVSPLPENTAYYYKVVSGADTSAVYTFRTLSRSATSFRFVAFGDSRSNATMVHTLSGKVAALDPKPALAIHTGDVVSDGTNYSLWGSEWFTPEHPMMANLPVFTAIGNHENNSPNYFNLFSLPGNERWYYVEYGNAVFIALDTTTASTTAPGSAQYQFLEATLRQFAGKTWKFVFFHHPPFSTGSHGSDLTVRANLQPLFDLYRVNMVFSGHDHDYERSEADGVTYIVAGGFGAPLYDQFTWSEYSKFYAKSYHYCIIDISGNNLTMTVKNSSDSTIETVGLSSVPVPPTSYIDSPADGTEVAGPSVTITGHAEAPPSSPGLQRVEVSVDGGSTWRKATGTGSWSYVFNIAKAGVYQVKSRAVDLSDVTEAPAAGVTVYALRTASPELQHYGWDAWPGAGECSFCHSGPGAFLDGEFRRGSGFCYSCHNSASAGHDRPVFKSDHRPLANISAAGKTPSYGNVTAGLYNDQPFARLAPGGLMTCMTCHNAMSKTADYGRVWEPTTNPSGDHTKYYLQYGGWSAFGAFPPRVYRDRTLWASGGPAYSKAKKNYLVDPAEYAYNEVSGFIRFKTQQDPASYVYLTVDYPYLRAPAQDNALCSDCHTQATHKDIGCLNCHQAHNSGNAKGISEKVRTTGYSSVPVRFLRYTGPDSFADGGPAHGGICEVCHTETRYYRRDGSGFVNHSGGLRYDGKDCTACHSHESGFGLL